MTKRSSENPVPDSKDKSEATEKDDDGSFFRRWSERKRVAVQEESLSEIAVDSQQTDSLQPPGSLTHKEEQSSSEQQQANDKAVLTDADMPDIETLDADSDYSPFLSEGVSKKLRNLALKKLFFSGKFAVRDGLDDYDDDFTYFEPLGDTVTSDMKFHARRKEKARLAELEAEKEALENESVEQEEATEPENHEPENHEPENQEPEIQEADESVFAQADSENPAGDDEAESESAESKADPSDESRHENPLA